MLVRRALFKVQLTGDSCFSGRVVDCKIPGVEDLRVEQYGRYPELLLVTSYQMVMSYENALEWLKTSRNKVSWMRLTGIMEINGYIPGFYDIVKGSKPHEPRWEHCLNVVAVELPSPAEIADLTEP